MQALAGIGKVASTFGAKAQGASLGSKISAGGQVLQGVGEFQASRFEARQLEENADAIQATGQREAHQARKQGDIVTSNARAAAAAGGGAFDAGTAEVVGDIQSDAEFNSLALLYNSDRRAQAAREQAKQVRKGGNRALIGLLARGASTVLGG